MEEFRVNKYITLKLENDKTFIYVNNERFRQCNYLLLNISVSQLDDYFNEGSIDEVEGKLDHSQHYKTPGVQEIDPKTEFWGHCSNIQVWIEHDYDTRLIHRNLSFPLLKKLSDLGDPNAIKMFKDEIAKRIMTGYPPVITYLLKEGYLNYLNDEELEFLNQGVISEFLEKEVENLEKIITDENWTHFKDNIVMLKYTNNEQFLKKYQSLDVKIQREFENKVMQILKYHVGTKLVKAALKFSKMLDYDISRYKINKVYHKGSEFLVINNRLSMNHQEISDIEDIEGLKDLTELKALYLYGNYISEIKGLENLCKLTRLDLRNNKIVEIKGLENLVKLKDLALSDNQITEIKGIDTLKCLKNLEIAENKLTDIQGLEDLPFLESIFIKNNPIPQEIINNLGGINSFGKPLNMDKVIKYVNMKKLDEIKDPNVESLKYNGRKYYALDGEIDLSNKGILYLSEVEGIEELKSIIKLNLSNNQIKDISKISLLTNIKTLILDNNQIEDTSLLKGLIQLETLFLGFNNIKDGSPLKTLKSLKELDLCNNSISDFSFTNELENLKILYLNGNPIPNEVIEDFKKKYKIYEYVIFKHVRYYLTRGYGDKLSLSGSGIKDLDEIIGLKSITNIDHLDLSRNRIKEIKHLESMYKLNLLNLSQNQISEIKGLDKMKQLNWLDLSKNNISSIQNLDQLEKIRFLELSGNHISKIKGLEPVSSLISLNLSGNFIKKIENIENLKNLTELTLSSNQISKIEGLNGLRSLHSLVLSNNPISDIEGLENLTNLNLLEIKNTQISIKLIEKLGGFEMPRYGINRGRVKYPQNFLNYCITKNIPEELIISNKFIIYKGVKYFVRDDELNLMNLGINSLDEIEGLKKIEKLESLLLSNNNISEVHAKELPIIIKNLDLSHNSIIKIENFESLKDIDSLNLTKNPIPKLHLSDIKKICNCAETISYLGEEYFIIHGKLNLSSKNINNIEEIEGLTELKSLIYLDLGFNKISKISGLNSLRNLQTLKLTYNIIEKIEGLENLVNLTSLSIDDNRLTKIEGLEKLINLVKLNLGGGKIEKISGMNELIKLERLDLTGNKISTIEGLNHLINLRELSLGYNKITQMEGFDNLRNLTNLRLSRNNIKELKGVGKLFKLQYLELSGNPVEKIENLEHSINLRILNIGRRNQGPFRDIKNLESDAQNIVYECQERLIKTNPQAIKDKVRFNDKTYYAWGEHLDLSGLGITDISEIKGLQNIQQLHSLDLSKNKIMQINHLESLRELEKLNLSENKISEIRGLDELIQLENLILNENNITKIECLETLTNLHHLNLSDNNISEIPVMENLKNLRSLNLSNNQIKEIKNIDLLKSLTTLILANNKISELKGINGLIELRFLNVAKNHISKITPLKDLPNLSSILGLDADQFTSEDVEIIKEWAEEDYDIEIFAKDDYKTIFQKEFLPEKILSLRKKYPKRRF